MHLAHVLLDHLFGRLCKQEGRVDGEEITLHGRLRVSGEIARDRRQHAAAQWSGFADGRQDASAEREDLDDENGVIR